MAETGLRTNHQSRVDWWRLQFQRQQKANLSVTELCRQLGVSVTTFYYWKKRVHEASPRSPGQVAARYPSRRPTTAGTTAASVPTRASRMNTSYCSGCFSGHAVSGCRKRPGS